MKIASMCDVQKQNPLGVDSLTMNVLVEKFRVVCMVTIVAESAGNVIHSRQVT